MKVNLDPKSIARRERRHIAERLERELARVERRIETRHGEIDQGGGHWSSSDYEEDDVDLGVAEGLLKAIRIVRHGARFGAREEPSTATRPTSVRT